MQDESLEAHGPVLAAAAMLAGIGWVGLIALIIAAIPTLFPRWLFFALWLMALTGTAAPFVRLLHRRFTPAAAPPVPGSVILRQSLWVGIFGAACAWLQIGRVFSIPVALLLAASLVTIEWFLRARDQSRRQLHVPPGEGAEEE